MSLFGHIIPIKYKNLPYIMNKCHRSMHPPVLIFNFLYYIYIYKYIFVKQTHTNTREREIDSNTKTHHNFT